jgi:3-oxoacyl-[acyl-carrier protein] reductase
VTDGGPARTAVVTGGGTGIGRGIVALLAADGWRIAVVGRRRAVLEEVAAETGALTVAADLAEPAAVRRAAADVVEALGTVDALVLNAGSAQRGPQDTLEQVAAHWSTTMAQNLLPAVLLEHALRPHLRRPGGRVVAISSAAARVAGGEVAYAASKAAMNRWVVGLAAALGGEGITVNAVAPGLVPDTGLYGEGLEPAWNERAARGIAVRRTGMPEDVADAVRWLISPGTGFVTGTVVEVDGGRRS